MQSTQYLFVYGSLRSGFTSGAYAYISRHFTLVSNAVAQATLYNMGDFPVAVPTNDDRTLKGELYVLNFADEFNFAMGQLDDYEGVHGYDDEPAWYKRETTIVTKEDGTTQEAWVYWYTGNVDGKPVVESGDVLDYMAQKNAAQ